MATVAHHHSMLAEQGIFCVAIVLKEQGFPLLLLMAFLTFVTEPGVMDIVLFVARMAVGRRLVFEQRALMTALAFCPSVVSL